MSSRSGSNPELVSSRSGSSPERDNPAAASIRTRRRQWSGSRGPGSSHMGSNPGWAKIRMHRNLGSRTHPSR
ncbi:hypothetical protein ACFWPX_27240 [Nocardia sp. NPDC058518]|uniref:hypothetical protein n=1 Tax=Nocardia sp. NPDC058518 TaxID=3346534 RepID=UPI0036544F39